MTSTWKVIFKFVERASHNSICQIESFLHTVSMMYIYIDIQDSLVSLKQLQDSQHTVVYVA